MTIITINTTPISEHINKFFDNLGSDGLLIILICIVVYFLLGIIQDEIKCKKLKEDRIMKDKITTRYENDLKDILDLPLNEYKEKREKLQDKYFNTLRKLNLNDIDYY